MDTTTRTVLDTARRLMNFRTTADHPDQLETCIEYIASTFTDTGLHVERFTRNGKPSLVVSFHDTKNPCVMLNGHIDVVPGPEDVFTPRLKDGKLYGRGAADMKTGVAAFMTLLHEFDQEGERPDLGLMVVSDEETGGVNGTKYLVDEEEYRPAFMIAGEPNHGNPCEMVICTEQKGILKLRLKGDGKSAHSSRPWTGENAITQVMEAYRTVASLIEEERGDREKGEDRWHATAIPVQIRGGDALNTVPAGAELMVDIRYTEDTGIDRVLETVQSFEHVSVDVIRRKPVVNNMNEPYIDALKQAAATVYDTVALGRTHGSSDLCFVAPHNIPAVEYGPTGRHLHSDNEFVYVESVPRYYTGLKRFVEHVA